MQIKRTVKVWDKHEVTVYKKSKSVWIAAGEYMGKRLEVKGRTDAQAEKAWRDTATYRGSL